MWRTEKRHPSRMLLVASGRPYTYSKTPDFAAATVTNAITGAAQEHNPTSPLTPAVAAPALTAVATEAVPGLCPPLPLPMLRRMPTRHGCNQRKELNLNIDLSPLPVTKAMVRKRKVTTSHACELTCSPYKNNLVEKTMMSKKSKPDRRKKLVKQSKVGPEKAMPTRPVPTEEPSTSNTTATQSRAHKSSDPPKPSRLLLIKDIEGCRTGAAF